MPCCSTGGTPAGPEIAAPSVSSPPRPSLRRRVAALLQWAVPITTLAIVPKCPLCVATYVILISGIGLSIQTAAALRLCLIALSIAALSYLILRTARRSLGRFRRRRLLPLQPRSSEPLH